MIKFINLDNGYTYMGEQPYIHWFPGQQSTNIIYTMPLCFMSECDSIYAYIKPEVFYLLNIQQDKPNENIKLNDISYANLNDLVFFPSDEEPSMKLQGTPYSVGDKTYYIYLLYIMAQSETGNECISSLQLIENYGEPVYNIFKVGADFYEENENLSVLLSNFGINLPTSIQKCFWDSNIYEEKPDNIILNRKFKELLSNYWDIIANKGSYKSLVNSLKWFEWGDNLKVNDVWVKQDFDRIRYEEKPLITFLSDKYKSTINGFAKTTFISLNYALRKVASDKWDGYNPVLEDVVSKWSKQDLMLKLSLLHRFYETYFLPIHEQIFHATVDDMVFGDVIQLISHSDNHKGTFIHDVKDFDIIVNNDEPIYVSNVRACVDKDTLFCNPYIGETDYEDILGKYDEEYDEYDVVKPKHTIVGAKKLEDVWLTKDNIEPTDDDLKNIYLQNYTGLGAIVPISCKLDLGTTWDMIHSETISINLGPSNVSYSHDEPYYDDWDEESIVVHDNKIFTPTLIDGHYIVDIDFNILCKTHSLVGVSCQLMFRSIGGQTFVKTKEFEVFSDANVSLQLYRVNHVEDVASLYINDKVPEIPNNYLLNNIKDKSLEESLINQEVKLNQLYKTYLPSRNIGKIDYFGEGKPFILAYGYDDEGEEIVQTEHYDFKYKNNKYTLVDKRYNGEDNSNYSYLVKLFIPINSKEYLKNLNYKVTYNISGKNTTDHLDTSCYICDKNDFNIYSDKITTGYIANDSLVKEADLIVNKDINDEAYLCISLSTFSAWQSVEIDSVKVTCPNMTGIAFNNLLILKDWEISKEIKDKLNLEENYITHKKEIVPREGDSNIDPTKPQVLIKSDNLYQSAWQNNISFENMVENTKSKVSLKYGNFEICDSLEMKFKGNENNPNNSLTIICIIRCGDGEDIYEEWTQKNADDSKLIKIKPSRDKNIKSVEIIAKEGDWTYFEIENVTFNHKKYNDEYYLVKSPANMTYIWQFENNDIEPIVLSEGDNHSSEANITLFVNMFDSGIAIENSPNSDQSKSEHGSLLINYKLPEGAYDASFDLYDSNMDTIDTYYSIYLDNEYIETINKTDLIYRKTFNITNTDPGDHTIKIEINGKFGYMELSDLNYKVNKSYSICVSKEFWYDPTELIKDIPTEAIYRNDLVFFPEHHKLVPFGMIKDEDKYVRSENEEDYMLRNNDVLAVIPKISCNGKPVDFKWSNELDQNKTSWEFENLVTGKVYKYKYLQQPYVLGDDGELEKGYYSITFNYKLTDTENTHQVKTGSAFIKK